MEKNNKVDFLKKYTIEYGTLNQRIDIKQKVLLSCLTGNNIFIPSGDFNRANIFGDPVEKFLKSIFINGIEYKHYSKIFIDSFNTVYQIDEVPKELELLDISKKHSEIKNKLKIKHGSFEEEYPEQLMAVKYLTGNEKVLEIGGNIGRNTLIIASIIEPSNLVSLECDQKSYEQLNENKNLNGLNFFIENSALSDKKLIQMGWDTIQSDTILDGYTSVNTITLTELKEKYPIEFDTLVLDCEGAFFYILEDFPEILNGINLIIMENDYNDIKQKEYVDLVLRQNGLDIVHQEGGGWGPCYNFFYEVWKR